MKKHWKRIVKQYHKKAKEWLNAQKYYALAFIKRSISMFTALVTVFSLGIFVVVTALMAENVHTTYIEYKVGSNTLYIRSPEDAKKRGSGTAFAMKTPSGKVVTVTNAHICELANDQGIIMIQDKKHTGRLIPKRVVEVYPDNDLCIVEGMVGYDGLELGDEVKIGQRVWALGYPLGEGLNVARGRVKGFATIKMMDDTPLDKCEGKRFKKEKINFFFMEIQVCTKLYETTATDLEIHPGNSGSALVNNMGNVVGVVFAANSLTHWGHAVVLKDLKQLLSAY